MVISSSFSLAFFVLTLSNVLLLSTSSHYNNHSRQALEIIIGGGGSYPPSPPPDNSECPPPLPPLPPPVKLLPPPPRPVKPTPQPSNPPAELPLIFENKRLERAYYVIQKFKKKITSDPKHITDTWVGPKVCDYKGFICDKLTTVNERSIALVNFNGHKFNGPDLVLEGFMDELPDIIVFHANSNFFKGSIPKYITKVQSLFELDLSNNQYSCAFPYQVLAATNLTFLDLRFNYFSGTVPAQVFTLDVDVLFVNNNNFFQNIPENLGSTPALYVTLANNNFTGGIPTSIGRARETLLEIVLLNNQLSGCLPCEIGLLEKATLFDASKNFLTGPIPLSFACLGEMQYLVLADNELYGPVPELLCKLPYLRNLTLSGNYFTTVGPECRKLIEKRVLDVRRNCVPGLPGQRSAKACQDFFRRAKRCYDGRWFHWMPCKGKGRRSLLELPGSGGPRAYEALNPGML